MLDMIPHENPAISISSIVGAKAPITKVDDLSGKIIRQTRARIGDVGSGYRYFAGSADEHRDGGGWSEARRALRSGGATLRRATGPRPGGEALRKRCARR